MSLYTFTGICPSAEGTRQITGACEAAAEEEAASLAADVVLARLGLTFKSFTATLAEQPCVLADTSVELL